MTTTMLVPPLPKRYDSLQRDRPGTHELTMIQPSCLECQGDANKNRAEFGKGVKISRVGENDKFSDVRYTSISETSCIFEDVNHYKSSFHTLYEFYKNGEFCDVEIIVGKVIFEAHRVVLACCSEYFCTKFLKEPFERSKQQVKICDSLDYGAVDDLLQFCYLSRIAITVNNVQALLHASCVLKITPVTDACHQFMMQHLHLSNCVAIYSYSVEHGHMELLDITRDFICENFIEFIEQDEIGKFPLSLMEYLLKSDRLMVDNEAQIYEAVIKWINYDESTRKQALLSLMTYVKLPLLAPSYLMANVENERLMLESHECQGLLDEAKSYQMSLVSLLPELKVTHRTMARKSYAGVILCVGGRGAAGAPYMSTECYDVRYDMWCSLAPMNERRRHVALCSAAGLVYAIGGHNGNMHLSSCEMFHPSKNQWTSFASMATKRRGLAAACLGGPLYAVGGLDDERCYRHVERYDSATDTWSRVADMNVARAGVSVVPLKGQLYAIGGNDGVTSLSSCERYDPFYNKWVHVAGMDARRAGAGAAVLNGYIYVVGGFDDATPLSSVERYNPHTNTWMQVGEMYVRRGGVGACALGGQLYAIGGHDGTAYLSTVEVYNVTMDRWAVASSTGECRAGAGVVFCDYPARAVLDTFV